MKLRGLDVLTALQDGTTRLDDAALLDRATQLERVLFSRDDDLLAEAVLRQRKGIRFHGVVYAHQLRASIGTCIDNLETIAMASNTDEVVSQILFLPL